MCFIHFCPVQENTLQVVIATNGQASFALFLYSNIEWGSANIGFNAGDGIRSFMIPGALTPQTRNIENGSNVDVPGLYIYRLDQRFVFDGENCSMRLLVPSSLISTCINWQNEWEHVATPQCGNHVSEKCLSYIVRCCTNFYTRIY